MDPGAMPHAAEALQILDGLGAGAGGADVAIVVKVRRQRTVEGCTAAAAP